MYLASLIALVGCAAAWMKLGYRGVSESETIDVVQAITSADNQVAMLIRRSDHFALSGDTYFVFVANRQYSVPELRKELSSLNPVFVAGRSGLRIGWSSATDLTIQCIGCGITKQITEKQRFSSGKVVIRYVDFP